MNLYKSKQYPVPASGLNGLILSIGFGSFVGLFLWFFEPFATNDYSGFEVSVFGFISFIVFFIAHFLLPLISPTIYPENRWTVFTQILFYTFLLLVIATLNGLYINYIENLSFSWRNYWFIIIRTLVLGVIPITIYTFMSFYVKYKNMVQQAEKVNANITNHPKQDSPITVSIQTEVQSDKISIELSDFLFAKSDNNYVEVFLLNEKTDLLRLQLSNLHDQFKGHENIVRCHRSYLVNLDNVLSVSGNAQGLKLKMKGENLSVPVSRKYVDFIKAKTLS